MKEKKLIIGVTAIIVIVIIIAVVFKLSENNEQNNPTAPAVTTKAATQAAQDNVGDAPADTPDDGETNFWDNVQIFEGDGDVVQENKDPETETDDKGEVVTDDKGEAVTKEPKDEGLGIVVEEGGDSNSGETISEEYPGQADGWSPLVSPDDLK